MDKATPTNKRILFSVCGVAFAAPALFFSYYTLRLLYLNVTMSADEAEAHRTGGMLIGAVAFPVAAVMCGLLSWIFLKKGFFRK
jgi:hypothetical protein